MRVLYVLAHFPQGSESYVEAEIRYAISKGIEISVWSPKSGYGDYPIVPVRRGSLEEALKDFNPDVVHVHHMTTAAFYVDRLPKGRVTVRAHSFDWDELLAMRLVMHPTVKAVFAFPHLARKVGRVIPLPVAYDPVLHYRSEKDRNSVIRLSAGLPTKRLEDFVILGNRLGSSADCTLAVSLVLGKEHQVFDEMSRLNDSLGGHVRILNNLSRAASVELTRKASIYVMTCDEKSHAFGMPISMIEAMATGAMVIAPEAEGVAEYMGEAKVTYSSIDEAEMLVKVALQFSDDERKIVSDVSCRNAERFRSDVVLPRLIEEWNRICLDNF